ncbi:hypothetical protein GOODEAATRI_020587 [Goodea atripinnis]|uniref:Uncharacterized protein n=1 Tax=Goodea atripinnis TaxID=208336 RepID=A0ABV0MTT3_9TELE
MKRTSEQKPCIGRDQKSQRLREITKLTICGTQSQPLGHDLMTLRARQRTRSYQVEVRGGDRLLAPCPDGSNPPSATHPPEPRPKTPLGWRGGLVKSQPQEGDGRRLVSIPSSGLQHRRGGDGEVQNRNFSVS